MRNELLPKKLHDYSSGFSEGGRGYQISSECRRDEVVASDINSANFLEIFKMQQLVDVRQHTTTDSFYTRSLLPTLEGCRLFVT